MGFSCVMCGNGAGMPVYMNCKDYYLNKPFIVDYWKCDSCGLTQQHPMPTDTSAFYDNYPIHEKKSWLFRKMRSIVMKPVYFPVNTLSPESRLLDYGCGDGGFLDASLEAPLELLGFEPNQPHSKRLSQQLSSS